jgi:hypothetical protein
VCSLYNTVASPEGCSELRLIIGGWENETSNLRARAVLNERYGGLLRGRFVIDGMTKFCRLHMPRWWSVAIPLRDQKFGTLSPGVQYFETTRPNGPQRSGKLLLQTFWDLIGSICFFGAH